VPARFTCPRGHEWEPTSAAAEQSGCPICGTVDETLAPESAPPALASVDATLPPSSLPYAPPPAPERPKVPGYEILGELGRGGMGVVYKARHLRLDRLVALKMVLTGAHAGPQELERFRIEAQAVAHLQHANIVQIYEVGEQDGLPFFSLEFVDGGSLAGKLAGQPQPAPSAAAMVALLARAMHHAHLQGIVHRDLKPANVLLMADGTPKITDFGLAKQLDGKEGPTVSGSIMGTPSYMAPEQASGQRAAQGPAADVYALGAILYEMLTGRPPFQADTPMDTLLQVVRDETLPPSRIRHRVPRDLETICLKCLEKDPRRRYASAEALADDLSRFQRGEPILARPVGTLGRLVKWARRRPAVATLLGLMAMLTVVGFGLVTWKWLDAEAARGRAERAESQAVREAREANDARRAARELATGLVLDQGVALCQKGEVGRGLLYFASGLDGDEDADPAQQRALQANLAAWRPHVNPLRQCIDLPCEMRALACSRDGKRFATGGEDNLVRLWEFGDMKARILEGHKGPVRSVAFSPDGSLLLSGGGDGSAFVWDVAAGRPICSTALPQKGPCQAVAFGPDGKTVLLAGPGAYLYALEGKTLRQIDALKPREGKLSIPPRAAAFSPDGLTIVTGSWQATVGRLWDAVTHEEIPLEPENQTPMIAVAFSPDGKRFLSCSGPQKFAYLRDARTGEVIDKLPHPHAVNGVAFSAGGKTLLTTCADRTARVWRADSLAPVGQPLPHPDVIQAAALHPSGDVVLTCGKDRTLRVWDVAVGAPVVVFPPDPAVEGRRQGHDSIAVSPDGRLILTGGRDFFCRLWRLEDGKPVQVQALEQKAVVAAVAFAPDGKGAATASGGSVRLWGLDPAKERPLASVPRLDFEAHKAPGRGLHVRDVAFSPDGKRLLTGGVDGAAKLWRVDDGKLLRTLRHGGPVLAVAISPDGGRLATACDDGKVRLWDGQTEEALIQLEGHEGPATCVAFSADGRWLLSGGLDQTARLWDAGTGKPAGPPMEHEGALTRVAFSPDGGTLVTASRDNHVWVWDRATGKPIGRRLAHTGSVLALAVAPDGRTALSGGVDQPSVYLWTLPERLAGGDAERERLRAQVLTGMELGRDRVVRPLDAAAWRRRAERLRRLDEGE
jgi:WD40 repeat protein